MYRHQGLDGCSLRDDFWAAAAEFHSFCPQIIEDLDRSAILEMGPRKKISHGRLPSLGRGREVGGRSVNTAGAERLFGWVPNPRRRAMTPLSPAASSRHKSAPRQPVAAGRGEAGSTSGLTAKQQVAGLRARREMRSRPSCSPRKIASGGRRSSRLGSRQRPDGGPADTRRQRRPKCGSALEPDLHRGERLGRGGQPTGSLVAALRQAGGGRWAALDRAWSTRPPSAHSTRNQRSIQALLCLAPFCARRAGCALPPADGLGDLSGRKAQSDLRFAPLATRSSVRAMTAA